MMSRPSAYAVLAGLALFVPLPWLDGWLHRRAVRALLREVARERGVVLSPRHLDVLTEDRSSLLVGCLGAAVIWPIKKFFRTILVVLLLKDVIDAAARAALVAAMTRAAFEAGALPDRVEEVRVAMDATLERYDWSPVKRFLVRGARPPGPWLGARDALARGVGALYRAGGGALILADFTARLGTSG
jgi:hypothetical protein